MEQLLKQRLTGAIVLVSLAVIFVPIILEGPDNEWTPRSHSIPEQPQIEYRTSMELELPVKVPASEGPSEDQLKIPAVESVQKQPAAKPDKPASKPGVVPKAVKPVSEPVPARKPVPFKGWYVQVGSFGLELNASGLRDRLQSSGFNVRIKKVDIGKGKAYRVLVGPSASRATAEKLAEKIQSGQKLKGMVIEYPG